MKIVVKRFNDLTNIELYEILKLRNEVFIVEQNCAYQDCDNKDFKSYHILSYDNENIVAYLRVLEKSVSYNEVSIGRVLVKKNYRGKGIARKNMLYAMLFIEDKLKEDRIRISAQQYLLEFYKSLGFKVVSDIYLEDNIPHVEMFFEK
ncbi:GNAT family N-acetyltransferase [Clostridium ihumii]|uniref:GNAT family N-acetyltransferase n=1 Tax=Clostridium ihumii TaxID=1470356 RepID=UPI00058B2477|nr:GNAT family N-acetyltransferase [Clostridium ihumii]